MKTRMFLKTKTTQYITLAQLLPGRLHTLRGGEITGDGVGWGGVEDKGALATPDVEGSQQRLQGWLKRLGWLTVTVPAPRRSVLAPSPEGTQGSATTGLGLP